MGLKRRFKIQHRNIKGRSSTEKYKRNRRLKYSQPLLCCQSLQFYAVILMYGKMAYTKKPKKSLKVPQALKCSILIEKKNALPLPPSRANRTIS